MNNDTESEKKLHAEFLELSGSALPNDFEERFAYNLSLHKSPAEAYKDAGYAPTGQYKERAAELAKTHSILMRWSQFEHSWDILTIKYGAYFRAQEKAKTEPAPDINALVESIRAMAPRLAIVTFRVAISHGLYTGANNALLDSKDDQNDFRELVAGYRQDATAMTVIRLCALLDRGEKIVSFQSVYEKLIVPGVAEELIVREKSLASRFFADAAESTARDKISEFIGTYKEIFESSSRVYDRLTHFRNLELAHLTADEITKHITYNDLDFLVKKVTQLAVALGSFAPTDIVFHGDEAEEYAKRSTLFAMRALAPD